MDNFQSKPPNNNAANNQLQTPIQFQQSSYAQRDRPNDNTGVKSLTNQVQMVELTSPRNAIGGVSGVVTNQ